MQINGNNMSKPTVPKTNLVQVIVGKVAATGGSGFTQALIGMGIGIGKRAKSVVMTGKVDPLYFTAMQGAVRKGYAKQHPIGCPKPTIEVGTKLTTGYDGVILIGELEDSTRQFLNVYNEENANGPILHFTGFGGRPFRMDAISYTVDGTRDSKEIMQMVLALFGE